MYKRMSTQFYNKEKKNRVIFEKILNERVIAARFQDFINFEMASSENLLRLYLRQ